MIEFETFIGGGMVSMASDTFTPDVARRDGRVAALGTDLGDPDEVIDITGLVGSASMPTLR